MLRSFFQKKITMTICTMILLIFGLVACSNNSSPSDVKSDDSKKASNNSGETVNLKNNITMSNNKGTVKTDVDFTVNQLQPNKDVQLKWTTIDGHYKIENLYEFIGPTYTTNEIILTKGASDSNGIWKGSFTVPEGFGGDHTLFVTSGDAKIGQTGYFVKPTFTISPESGPVGTEISISVEGIGWKTYKSNWQLTYDNKYTGMISAASTKGKATAKIRAAGPIGKHSLSIRSGYLGSGYINIEQSPHANWPSPDFSFEVTDEEPLDQNRVEDIPVAADGGVEMPELKNNSGVQVNLDKDKGAVGETVTLSATGLPDNKKVDIVWNTMKGSRVTDSGFSEKTSTLGAVATDDTGDLTYEFQIPDDLGGLPHRIDLKVNEATYGQAYLRILPSIIDISPKSGPVGTKINVTINGGGWTEYDNAYYMTYDNAYMGYMCSFNSQGNLTFSIIATGNEGYHIMDLYPGVYKQKEKETDMTLIPQLTYSTDHPGSGMPAIRFGFEVTE